MDSFPEIEFAISPSVWLDPPNVLQMPEERIHLWKIPNITSTDNIRERLISLSPDEISRAERFHFDHDRARYIKSRAALRSILGLYLQVEPKEVRFIYGNKGKPYLADPFNQTGLKFNLSHSHEIGLIGVMSGSCIGVDVEFIRHENSIESIARRFLTDSESYQILTCPQHQQSEAFFRCWTLKEAFIKASGDGFTIPTDSFEVAFMPGFKSRMISIQGDQKKALEYSLFQIIPDPGYIGGIAIHNTVEHLEQWNWSS
jgi:4'-phosphopantetheinyl transferase